MKLYCPDCGSEIPTENVSLTGGQGTCPSCDRTFSLEEVIPGVTLAEEAEPRPPEETKIVVQHGRADEVTLYIPSRRSKFTVFFALVWNLITFTVTAGFVASGGFWEQPLFLVSFFAIFWAVGIGFLVAALFSVSGKTLVHVGGGQVAVKKELFGLGRLRRYPLEPGAVAGLAEAYEQNDRPVYACSVSTGTREVKFGSFLTDDEKAWLVAVINGTLGVSLSAAAIPESGVFCPGCGRALAGGLLSMSLGLAKCPDCSQVYLLRDLVASTQSAKTVSRPVGTNVQVEENGEELRVVVPPITSTGAGTAILIFVGVFGLIWLAGITLFTIVALHSGGGLVLILIPVGLLILTVVAGGLSYLRSPLELTFAEGVVEKRRKLLFFGREQTLPLPSRTQVEFQPPEAEGPAGVRQAPPSWTPLGLRYEGGMLAFGFLLSTQEKRWLQQRINDFLDRRQTAER